ncbi:unnamed protein product [Vitrella brassicaformis CCMP3155]|uniref:Uncharacterized protein n=2 Tax=Vitrella brassicaformis TaxID=1169539 RepID=A0A0G4FG70_VITBC|nr:unnamed protein product [Vitrella brassicaformis CCMP3155]|mmetsp:Transcript_47189/g.117732  ORF Transcript_47189/g.117732 Transcript_47189/m.117732 type:complete len:306 (+) Transcript_47189:54-971(+)|eukprot:CEM12159.1 unnamed protein product [Vitrella brassicaformis CCMP3155]
MATESAEPSTLTNGAKAADADPSQAAVTTQEELDEKVKALAEEVKALRSDLNDVKQKSLRSSREVGQLKVVIHELHQLLTGSVQGRSSEAAGSLPAEESPEAQDQHDEDGHGGEGGGGNSGRRRRRGRGTARQDIQPKVPQVQWRQKGLAHTDEAAAPKSPEDGTPASQAARGDESHGETPEEGAKDENGRGDRSGRNRRRHNGRRGGSGAKGAGAAADKSASPANAAGKGGAGGRASGSAPAMTDQQRKEEEQLKEVFRNANTPDEVKNAMQRARELDLSYLVELGGKKLKKVEDAASAPSGPA